MILESQRKYIYGAVITSVVLEKYSTFLGLGCLLPQCVSLVIEVTVIIVVWFLVIHWCGFSRYFFSLIGLESSE